MPVYLLDNFDRTGPIDASAPNIVSASGEVWLAYLSDGDDVSPECNSGRMTTTDAGTSASIVASTVTPAPGTELSTSIIVGAGPFRTEAVIVDIAVYVNQTHYYEARVLTDDLGTPRLEITTGAEFTTTGPYAVTLSPNTTYPVKLTLSPGSQTFNLLGHTVNSADSYATVSADTSVMLGGAPGIDIGPVAFGGPVVGATLSLPSLSCQAAGTVTVPPVSSADISLPALSVYINVLGDAPPAASEVNMQLPSLALAARAGANTKLTLPSLTSRAAGTVTTVARANLTLPGLTTAASATSAHTGSAALTLPSMSGKSYAGALCSVTIGAVTAKATGTTGVVGSLSASLPLFEVKSVAAEQNHGSAHLTLPSLSLHSGGNGAAITLPGLELVAIGSAVITATYEAYAVNLKHADPNASAETTRYTNFPFTHVVRYKNSYYGANSTGLYLLEGTTDNGAAIPWAFKTAMTDFKSANKKTLAAAYFSGRFGPASTIRLHEGEKTPQTYSFTTPRGTLAQNHRQKFGKGTKGRYYALSAAGTGACELDGIELDVQNTTRRI